MIQEEIFVTLPDRVMRFFVGGSGIDSWQGLPDRGDGNMSEELLINTNEYIGPGDPPDHGYSLTEKGGRPVSLKSLIDADPVGMLGRNATEAAYGCPVLCKAGDSTGRLILQYHPTADFAKRYLGCPYGKTEAWYILKTRTGGGSACLAGFKNGVTRERFVKLFEADDREGMLDCIHRVPVQAGDMLLIRAGMVHAMGENTTFLEIHEPCDYTMRLERETYGRRMSDDDLHYGLGFERLFDGLSWQTYTAEEIAAAVRQPSWELESGAGYTRRGILSREACPEFSADMLELHGGYTMAGADSCRLLIAVEGDAELENAAGAKRLPQGRAAFIPAAAGDVELRSERASVMLIYLPMRQEAF